MHRLLPVLHQARADRGMQPARAARRVAGHPLTWEGAPDVAIAGPARRRHRPGEPTKHREHSSGTQTAHTDKNLLLVNETTSTVVSRGPTEPGKPHDKQAADPAQRVSPINAMRDKDTGLQGDAPTGVLTRQPKKSPKARHEVGGIASCIPSAPVPAWSWKTCVLESNGVGWSKMSCAGPKEVYPIWSWQLPVVYLISVSVTVTRYRHSMC